MDLLNKTGVPIKYSGDGLKHTELNSINSTTNSCVDGSNYFLKSFCNVNTECNDYGRVFTLEQAIKQVPESRRSPGLKIRFLSEYDMYVEYTYSYVDVTSENWLDVNNWSCNTVGPGNIIDGGEW